MLLQMFLCILSLRIKGMESLLGSESLSPSLEVKTATIPRWETGISSWEMDTLLSLSKDEAQNLSP